MKKLINQITFNLKLFNEEPAKIVIIDNNKLLNDDILQQVKEYLKTKLVVYHNDLNCKHWIFDFKIGNIWIESKYITNSFDKFVLNCYN